jgi:methanogenic corrinoid protein MtbC1
VIVGGPAFGMEDPVAANLASKLGADAYARTPTAAASLVGLMD